MSGIIALGVLQFVIVTMIQLAGLYNFDDFFGRSKAVFTLWQYIIAAFVPVVGIIGVVIYKIIKRTMRLQEED